MSKLNYKIKSSTLVLSFAILVVSGGLPFTNIISVFGEHGGTFPFHDRMTGYAYRTINGTGNNIANPTWGSAGVALLRVSHADYGDGISTPAGASRPSPRDISNIIAAQGDISSPNSIPASDFMWQWGQFLDHDMDLTPTTSNPPEELDIQVPTGDPFFDPLSTGTKVINFQRSVHDNGNSVEHPRQQPNVDTAFIDASMVYGSDPTRAAFLRTFSGGHLKESSGGLLPYNTAGLPNAGGTSPSLYLAGDVRANEQVDLSATHTVFVREHNRIADMIAAQRPELDDETIYQIARKVVGAEIEVITYKEFLPDLLGVGSIPAYHGYNPAINPGIATEFSTAAFRVGHTMLSSELMRMNHTGGVTMLPLRDDFFNPSLLTVDDGVDSFMRGLYAQRSQQIDNKIVDDVRNFLFGPPGSGGFDLASLNIQRGRDNGLPDYNSVRVAYGLPAVTSFAQISSNATVQAELAKAYGNVNNIDLWVGALAEDHVPGAMVGPTIKTILVDQFTRVRDGDRFWYQHDPFFTQHRALMTAIQKVTLSDIIIHNTDVGHVLPENVFKCGNFKGLYTGLEVCN